MRRSASFTILSFCLSLKLFADPVTEELLTDEKIKPTVVDFGYNKFKPSPYSKQVVAIPFDSPEGIQLFEQSKHKKAFFKLAPHYSPQQTITNCGIRSSVIILNTVYAEAKKTPPISISGSHYDKSNNTIYGQFMWIEPNFYTPQVRKKLDQAVVEGKKQVDNCYVLGVSLDQLADTLRLQGLSVEANM